MSEQVIVVGHTEKDGFGNLWVTPKGGGERIKIAAKREGLHGLFQQGVAVMLDWQTYMYKPYVADAKLVGEQLGEMAETPPDMTAIEESAEKGGTTAPKVERTRNDEITENMFWNHLKDWLMLKENDEPKDAFWLHMRSEYFKKMMGVLPIAPYNAKEEGAINDR